MDEERKVIAFQRWDAGGPGDDVVVVANFHRGQQEGYVIGFPSAGPWKLRFNSDWQGYSDAFEGRPSSDVVAEPGAHDGLPAYAAISVGSYSVLIYSQ